MSFTGNGGGVAHRLRYTSSAEADLTAIYHWISDRADPDTAFAYVERLEAACRALMAFPARGTPRPDAGANIRSVAFERRATIFYTADHEAVRIIRILQRGRDPTREFGIR